MGKDDALGQEAFSPKLSALCGIPIRDRQGLN